MKTNDNDDEYSLLGGKKALFKIVIYLGESRPFDNKDYGLKLISEFIKKGYNVTALILKESDPINQKPDVLPVNIKKFILPDVLTLKRTDIKEMLKRKDVLDKVNTWIGDIKKLDIDLGIIFYGFWLPPEMYDVAKMGFINFHPGPLPYLKGIEPDTFVILEGWKKAWGAVHKVVPNFDEGDIITKTKTLKVSKYSTPVEVLLKLTALGINAILKAIKNILNNKPAYKMKNGSIATIARARKESYIQWENDDIKMIDRKIRAFSGQDIKIRLKAVINDKLYYIYNLETYKSNNKLIRSFKEGTIFGFYQPEGNYHLMPIIKAKDGVVIILGHEDNGVPECDLPFTKENIIAPKKRKYETNFKMIKNSIMKNIQRGETNE